MKTPLRLRLFFWLVALLILFVTLQFTIFSLIEFRAWLRHPEETLREHLMEAITGVGWDLAVLPLLIGVSWWISRRMIQPIRTITEAADSICSGHFEDRISTGNMPDDEMRRMAKTINAAFDYYHDAVDRLRRFSGDASHQLRTPLAVMQSVGEVALSRDRDPKEYRQALANMLEEVRRMSRVTEQLLRLARLERTEVRTSFAPLTIGQVVSRTVMIFQPLCQEKHVGLRVETEDELNVLGHEDLLIEMLANLLDNALRHTPSGGEILVKAEREPGDRVLLTVADTGPGIAPDLAERVFELFGQVPGTRQTGAGLGLAIVMAIAKVHGGRAELNSQHTLGAVFQVHLPTHSGRPASGQV
jgi:two-component system, OmpR family, heavy metal sensor histidine kinase CusS